MYKNNSFRHNVSGIGFDPAFVNTALNLNEAGETPSGAPGVADNPVGSGRNGGCGRGGTVSDDNDGVIDSIDVRRASRITVDSSSIDNGAISKLGRNTKYNYYYYQIVAISSYE